MKPTTTILALIFCSSSITAFAQVSDAIYASERKTISSTELKQKLNFFVVSKRKKGKLDPATSFNVLRTKIKSLWRPKNFVAIIAADADQASAKILHRLKKYNANIGTVWFDSHGLYKKGYSLFYIGHDEISFKKLKDSSFTNPFDSLTPYATNETRLVIGSCYGGATYHRSSIDYRDTTRMNGDSLMIALAKFFPQAKIYGSESWVMTKPGIFNDKGVAVAGFPKRKLFHDVCYRPAWENVGKWNEYNAATGTLTQINSVTLDSYGNLEVVRRSFNEKPATQKDIQKNILKLEADLFK
jgi:hypothetical protein